MKRYALAVTGVFPRQLITVTDCKEFAEEALEYLTNAISDDVVIDQIDQIDSFYPFQYVDADKVWLVHYDKFLSNRKDQ